MSSENFVYGIFAVIDATSFQLTYKIPDSLKEILPGTLCEVPLQKRLCVAVFLERCETPAFPCKEIHHILRWTQPFPHSLILLANWISSYYLVPKSKAFRLLAPGFIWDAKSQKTRDKRFEKIFSTPKISDTPCTFPTSIRGELTHTQAQPISLRAEQERALNEIFCCTLLVTLLFGVTGSGKTEVYLQAAQKILAQGKRVLVLVPEISLTPQMTSRFRSVFGDSLSVVHSMLTKVEYEREWFRIHHGSAQVVLGVRSAVFAPVQNLGLIIVDEEHDSSYKCEEMPTYNARDVAVKRATLENARCILGSATPSLESYSNVQIGRYNISTLESRHSGFKSTVDVYDAKKFIQFSNLNKRAIKKISRSSLVHFENNVIIPPVLERIRENREQGGQSMVILNRRGYASFALCSTCGNSLQCPHCAVSTTLHAHCSTERCHYCGFETSTRKTCSVCGGNEIIAMGAGTQSIEHELTQCIPDLRVARLDRDILTSNSRLGEILKQFRSGDVDCLVGTQLLAKGHDFPRVTLIVIMHVEDGLFMPDFRSSERTFQLLTQAAGRAGRGKTPGAVVVQSLVTGHPIIDLALQANVQAFLDREAEIRKIAWHPPFTRQILLEINSKSQSDSLAIGNTIREAIVSHWKSLKISNTEARIIGPQPATLEKLKGIYRTQIAITTLKNLIPAKLIPEHILNNPSLFRKVRIDVDPQSFM